MANSPPTLNRRLNGMSAFTGLCQTLGYLALSVAILVYVLKH